MEIKSEKIILELNNAEAWDLAFHIKRSLEDSIKEHYCYTGHDSYKRGYEGHAKPLFIEQCGKDIKIMRQILGCVRGESEWIEKELWNFFEKTYKEKNGSLTLEENK